MGRTYEALKRAEEERLLRQEGLTAVATKTTLQPYKPFRLSISDHVSEEYLRVKHNLCLLLPEYGSKVLLFVGSARGEGTSTVVATFAMILASSGERVLLIDANFRQPSQHDIFGVERANGVTESLFGSIPAKNFFKKTRINNLSILTSGLPPSNPALVLGSKKICSMIEQVKNEADWIVLDAPPVNEYCDAMAFCSEIDGVLFVVQAEKTKWEAAQKAKQRINDAGGKVVGVVLNRRKLYIPEWVYKWL